MTTTQGLKNLYHYLNANLAALYYGYPGKKLFTIGVTGTDGKTTTSFLIHHLLKSSSEKVLLVGTIGAYFENKLLDTGLHTTSPDPWKVNGLLYKALRKGYKYAVLEVTSHGLDQHRFSGVDFKIAVLTNITHEHLDYHHTLESYRDTKLKLFRNAKQSILNWDDDSSRYIDKKTGNKKLTYAVSTAADFRAKEVSFLLQKTSFKLVNQGETQIISTTLLGKYNVYNILAACATARYLSLSWQDIKKALLQVPQIPGRMEEIKNNKEIRIIIDFAHTPNALKNVLASFSGKNRGRLIVVFGCAGQRDKEKRVLMPKVAIDLADISIFTAEDPREESIGAILETMRESAIKKGAGEGKDFFVIHDRGEAIYTAVNKLAQKGDTVVICGKGHEKSMSYHGVEYPWSDQEAVMASLKGKIKKINL